MNQAGSTVLHQRLTKWAANQPNKACVTDVISNQTLTYEQVLRSVAAVGQVFGEAPQVVMVALPGGISSSVLWLTCLTGGHTLVPISPNLTDSEYAAMLTKHNPTFIIQDADHGPTGSATVTTASELNGIITDSLENEDEDVVLAEPKEGSVILATSGSTGKPKGIRLSASQCVITAQNIVTSHELTIDDRSLTPLPFYHVNAPIVSLLTTILTGSSLAIAAKYSTTNFWDWVKSYDPTWISLVPTLIAMVLTTEKPTFLETARVRFIRTASAQLPEATLKTFEAKYGLPLIETYGISEAAATITSNPVPPKIHKPGSVGLPIGIDLRICEPGKTADVAQGEVGEVCIQGNNVITAYEGGVGTDSFDAGWFRTSDLGYKDSDGYVFLVGRIKDIIIRGGENIFPREIEEVMYRFPDVAEAVVVGHAHELYGEKVVAYVTTQTAVTADFTTQLQRYLEEQLSRYKVPAEIHVLEAMPKTAANKIDKPLLRSLSGK